MHDTNRLSLEQPPGLAINWYGHSLIEFSFPEHINLYLGTSVLKNEKFVAAAKVNPSWRQKTFKSFVVVASLQGEAHRLSKKTSGFPINAAGLVLLTSLTEPGKTRRAINYVALKSEYLMYHENCLNG